MQRVRERAGQPRCGIVFKAVCAGWGTAASLRPLLRLQCGARQTAARQVAEPQRRKQATVMFAIWWKPTELISGRRGVVVDGQPVVAAMMSID